MNGQALLRRRIAPVAIGVMVGALVAGGFAFAAIPSTSTKQITACYPKSGPDKGKLRVIDSQRGAACTSSEATLEWSSTGVNWRGNWSVGTTYNTNDAVYYGGTTYRAKSGSVGITPGTNGTKWVYLARAGAQGPAGADGILDSPLHRATNVDDPAAGAGFASSVAIGVDGLPIVSHQSNDALRVTHCDDLACTTATSTTVDDPAEQVGQYSSIAIGTDGLPIISHRDTTNLALRVTHCDNVQCTSATSATVDDPAAVVGWYSSLTIGTDGLAIISHQNSDAGALRITHCDDVVCTSASSSNVDDPADDVGGMSSITIGSDGLPIISHFNTTVLGLRMTHCDDVLCTIATSTTVDNPANTVGFTTSIAIGTDGLPVVAHQDNTARAVRISHCNNVACTSATNTNVDDPAIYVGYGTSLAIGSDGMPVVAHLDNDAIRLRVTHCSNVVCSAATSLTIDGTSDLVGTTPNIAIGMDGYPVIGDYNSTANALRVTHCSNRFCLPNHRA